MSRKTFVAYRFSRFDDYWIKTNKQTPAHPDKQRALLYRLQAKSFLKGISYFPITQCFGFNFLYGLNQGLYLIRNRIQITIFTCNSHRFFDDVSFDLRNRHTSLLTYAKSALLHIRPTGTWFTAVRWTYRPQRPVH